MLIYFCLNQIDEALWEKEQFKSDKWLEEIFKEKKWERKEQFPEDWIAPGEFTFCHGCGMKLVPLDYKICTYCKYKYMPGNDKITKEKIKCDEVHETLKIQRQNLAYERKIAALIAQKATENNTGALFWV
jgi:hypothetical protein